MSDEAAFLTAIRARPDDEALRLVFADWLDGEEGGCRHVDAARQRVLARPDEDELRLAFADACERAGDADRAEFVRVQVEMAQIVAKGYGDPKEAVLGWDAEGNIVYRPPPLYQRYKELECRERELWSNDYQLSQRMLKEGPFAVLHLDDVSTRLSISGTVHRGFVGSVTASAADWLAHGDELTDRHPVRRVRHVGAPPTPKLCRVTTILPSDWGATVGDRFVKISERELMGLVGPRTTVDTVALAFLLYQKRWPNVIFDRVSAANPEAA